MARMDIVVALRGLTYYIDTAIVATFSSSVSLMTAASARLGYVAKREEEKKFDRYPRINLIPFILETTGRPGYHAQSSSDNSTATRTTHRQPSGTLGQLSKPHCTTASPNNSFEQSLRDRHDFCPTHGTPLLLSLHATSAHTPFGGLSAHLRFSAHDGPKRGRH